MAKNRRITREPQTNPTPLVVHDRSAGEESRLFTASTGQRVSTFMLGAALVYVAYWPHDSVDVQQGGARYLIIWLLIGALLSFLSFSSLRARDYGIDLLAWCVPAWMTLSLGAHQETANLRLGVNELGWWWATAAAITLARRVASDAETALACLRLMIALSLGVAVFGWHQWFIGIPNMIAEYQANPEAMLRQIGIVAEEGSAMRVVFENRLYDGGPTGTFALANSMAVMLLGGFIITVAVAMCSWKHVGTLQRITWCGIGLIVGGMLLAARSRAAVLALILIVGWIGLIRLIHAIPTKKFQPRSVAFAFVATLLSVLAGAAALMRMFRDSEWFAQAPASVAIRLNYWRACFGMLDESPWFGVGPGQFKASYQAFRAADSNEQIADPHQFLLQIATAGGWPALIIALMLMAALAWSFLTRVSSGPDDMLGPEDKNESALSSPHLSTNSSSWIFVGACTATLLVWLLGAGLAQLPVFDAGLLSTVVTVITATCLWYGSTIGFIDHARMRTTAAFAVGAMGIALLASGGITVPGVSLFAWTLAGIAVPVSLRPRSHELNSVNETSQWNRAAIGFALVAGAIVILWYGIGIAPVEKSLAFQNRFEARWSQGQIEPAIEALEAAADSDAYDVQPWLQLAAVYRTLAVAQVEKRADWETRWAQAEEQALDRTSLDPVIAKQLGDNRLIHYQRYGEPASLQRARELFERAVELSPSHEAYAAQLAAILQALGAPEAGERATRAEELSKAGGYYERSLAFTLIYVPENIGEATVKVPRQRPASEVLGALLKRQE